VTRYGRVALPCPVGDAWRAIHDAVVEAVQPHSRFVWMLIVPAPPSAANFDGELLACTEHLSTVLGAVADVVAEDEHPAPSAAVNTSR
jgi:hypothetical protein